MGAGLEIKAYTRCLVTGEIEISRKELKRQIVYREITTLEAETSKLVDLIRDVLCELDSKYTLNLLD